jgi:hypothetical protein
MSEQVEAIVRTYAGDSKRYTALMGYLERQDITVHTSDERAGCIGITATLGQIESLDHPSILRVFGAEAFC